VRDTVLAALVAAVVVALMLWAGWLLGTYVIAL
jgi:hypothetical protein